VARAVPPSEVFTAVTEEAGRLLGADYATMGRYDPDGAAQTVAAWSSNGAAVPVGTRTSLGGRNVHTLVFETGRAARISEYDTMAGAFGEVASTFGIRAAVGAPINVEGRLWGVMGLMSTREQPLPADTEVGLAAFTELAATAIAGAQARVELLGFAEEQAALRRVATLVAQAVPPEKVFAAITAEAGRLLNADVVVLNRYAPDETEEIVGVWVGAGVPPVAVGTRVPIGGRNVTSLVFQTGRSARIDGYADTTGQIADVARKVGVRASVGVPISVSGRLWGVILIATRLEPLPGDTEVRLAGFTELTATAIASAQTRVELRGLAEQEAALRRVATLVARAAPPAEIFSAVSDELARLFGAQAAVLKFESDGPSIVCVGVAETLDVQVGTRWTLQPGMASAEVYRTGGSGRVDDMGRLSASGPVAETARQLGIVSSVASPIVVEGRRWGAMSVTSTDEPLPIGTEARLEKFSGLLATAIANAESRSELAASRRRIVTASDEARRRIERDLHDGTQQRLVSLGLAARAAVVDVPADRSDLRAELTRIAAGLTDAVAELQELSRGIHPAIISSHGLGPALRTLARRSPVPVDLEVTTNARFPQPIEIAAYYVASEALANALKHAQASRIEISLTTRADGVLLSIRDDGAGGADPVRGSGLAGLADRVEALGGSIRLQSVVGSGTRITADLPVECQNAQEAR
jgi:signal transduction histidine kinase